MEFQAVKDGEDFKINTSQRMQNLEMTLEGLRKSISQNAASQGSWCVSYDMQVKEAVALCTEGLKELRGKLKDTVDEFNKKEKAHLERIISLEQKCASLNHMNILLSQHRNELANLHDQHVSLSKEMHSNIQAQDNTHDKNLKALKQEILSTPSGIPELKKSLDQKLDIAELNGQNAILRSSNNERHILLLEKKIENIYQLIKKLDLDKQAP